MFLAVRMHGGAKEVVIAVIARKKDTFLLYFPLNKVSGQLLKTKSSIISGRLGRIGMDQETRKSSYP